LLGMWVPESEISQPRGPDPRTQDGDEATALPLRGGYSHAPTAF